MNVVAVPSIAAALCWQQNKTAMLFISIQDLELAINFWRNKSPSQGEALQLCPQASSLAKPYALMIIQGAQRLPVEALSDNAKLAWSEYLQNRDHNGSGQ
jgi:hypothetical protein